MKRSMINISKMRKHGPRFALGTLSLAILAGCSPEPQTRIVYVETVDECKNQPGVSTEACMAAYQQAKARAEREMPRFMSVEECEKYYGECRDTKGGNSSNDNGGNNWVMPLVAGYVAAEMIDELGDAFESRHYRKNNYQYVPFRGSPTSSYKSYSTATEYKKVAPPPKAKPKPTIKSKSGFGSTAKAKSSWGSSSRSSGWGG
jgi:uncharacterized protein YgiB involved in biofilm formation